MAAYLLANYDVKDADLYKQYQKGAGPTLAGRSMKVLALDPQVEQVEGSGGGHQVVLIEFETMDELKAWYNSEEYQAVIGDRLAATENGVAFLVNGLG